MKLNLATTWLLLVAFTVNEVRGQLRCYVCENCPDPFEGTSAQLQACPASESTTTTQMPPGGDTTILTPPPLPTGDGSGQQQTTTTLAATTEAPPTPSTPVITPPPVVGRRKRQTAATGYRCFRIEHSNTVRRGCAAYLGNQADTCLSVNGGTNPTDCTLCDWEGCNSATGLRVSLFALLLAVLLSVVLKQ
ncbi:AGAP008116-PA [Anopheles gambiae str. PEST]|uniref:AGAP008116-PA n=2 Tax=gambiae species complex TaxID=44542 RepID=Q7Q3Z7_ANOGA|nr:AGAP008116-PA [Anopheles gambiae str. PEST]